MSMLKPAPSTAPESKASSHALLPYDPGQSVEALRRTYPAMDFIRLSANENPLGPGPMARQALQRMPQVSRYPDPAGHELKAALAAHLGVAEGRIILGNGSAEVLSLLARTFLERGDAMVTHQYAYSLFAILARTAGAACHEVPAQGWQPDLPAMARAVDRNTRLVLLANPNNPTGTWISQRQLDAFLGRIPAEVPVVVDEAYLEYATAGAFPDTVALQGKYPNLVITRTFSKAHGLAGLRIGYGIAREEIVAQVERLRLTFNINSIAHPVALAALQDQAHVARSREHNARERAKVQQRLSELQLQAIPSMGNFLAIDFNRPAKPIFNQLLQRGILARPLASYNMPNHLRVSLGTGKENQRLLALLEELLPKP
jgi:histidinol-phosphate aminotransferase